ncbi:hypothetical protein FNV43_RR18231 [Rhamnella rubrinervis]|uniref:Uncharacterized protein n=1 Tax=Rhamnella rubrinervis TaxID=2594499 RepID=A0A8K0E4R8_9ROSA|nr:hypothetical protein FNV43_RR18231 [Rhamnella rubrinervis]
MGGKGRRRREKNYRAAHGGYTRLPPAPVPSQVDALPSKLRMLMSLTSSQTQGDSKAAKDVKDKKKNGDGAAELKSKSGPKVDGITGVKDRNNDGHLVTPQHADNFDDNVNNIPNEKKKKKRNRKEVVDLRFETELEKSDASVRRRKRKKMYLEGRKNKHKKAKTGEELDFPGHEKVKFGDVAQAPPKLVVVPKALKIQDASKERIRLQAIESYRKRKGWTSRPGKQLPNHLITPMEL